MLIYQMIPENNSNKLEIWWAKWVSRKIQKQNEKLNFYMKPTWNFLWTAGGTRKILPKLILSLWHSVSHYNQSHPNPSFSHSNSCKLSKHGNISLLTKNENTLTDWKVLYKTSLIFPFTRYFRKIPVPIMSTAEWCECMKQIQNCQPITQITTRGHNTTAIFPQKIYLKNHLCSFMLAYVALATIVCDPLCTQVSSAAFGKPHLHFHFSYQLETKHHCWIKSFLHLHTEPRVSYDLKYPDSPGFVYPIWFMYLHNRFLLYIWCTL